MVLNGSYWSKRSGTGPNWSILVLTGVYCCEWSVLVLTGLYWAQLICTGPDWSILVLIDCNWFVLVLTSLYWFILVYTGLYWGGDWEPGGASGGFRVVLRLNWELLGATGTHQYWFLLGTNCSIPVLTALYWF